MSIQEFAQLVKDMRDAEDKYWLEVYINDSKSKELSSKAFSEWQALRTKVDAELPKFIDKYNCGNCINNSVCKKPNNHCCIGITFKE